MKLTKAYNYMIDLINKGVDYPVAQWEASKKFELTKDNDIIDKLNDMYDENEGKHTDRRDE